MEDEVRKEIKGRNENCWGGVIKVGRDDGRKD